jgi:hypothetical protein
VTNKRRDRKKVERCSWTKTSVLAEYTANPTSVYAARFNGTDEQLNALDKVGVPFDARWFVWCAVLNRHVPLRKGAWVVKDVEGWQVMSDAKFTTLYSRTVVDGPQTDIAVKLPRPNTNAGAVPNEVRFTSNDFEIAVVNGRVYAGSLDSKDWETQFDGKTMEDYALALLAASHYAQGKLAYKADMTDGSNK